ncbi:MAG TPA: amidohydrolase family protein [Pirellulales bacterium]|nr:amidohydrolase family protein [Pirellulales bacterium]
MSIRVALAILVFASLTTAGRAFDEPQLDGREGRNLALDQFRPRPKLTVAEHHLTHAKFPVVDVHTHPKIRFHHSPEQLDEFVRLMDQQRIAVCVSLDGGLGPSFDEHVRYLAKHRDRFVIFANVDWQGDGAKEDPASWDCQRADFARRTVVLLEHAKRQGASGLKLFKDFGLRYKNPDGSLLAVDDPRWDPIWAACGELGLPVIMHTADPSAFFDPIDEQNERWEELHRHPEWSFFGPQWPPRSPPAETPRSSSADTPRSPPAVTLRDELHAARNRVIERHPQTTFIAAHLGNDGEDLEQLSVWLDRYPNLVVEIASRIAELGRQPYTARRFFVKYADRIMFGTDGPRAAGRLLPYWRFLETFDEYFPYAENDFPPQGFWHIYGIGLPDDVLRKVYHENAARIIPGVKEKLEAYQQLRR